MFDNKAENELKSKKGGAMRRLPVYLLLDTSGSMLGEPIEAVKNGVEMLVSSLRQDPYALETAFLFMISFDTAAKQLMPLTEVAMFNPPAPPEVNVVL